MRARRLLKNQQGFTLIEIIAVLILLGILSAVAVPKYMDMQTEAQAKAVQGAIAAAASNATMAYSKFLLTNSVQPSAISSDAWSDGGSNTLAINTTLGDFDAGYSFDNSTGEVTVTIKSNGTTTPGWFDSFSGTKTKTFAVQ